MRFDKKITLDAACHNFRRLWGSDDMIKYFAEEYAKARHFEVDLCIAKTLKYRNKFWRYFNKKYPDTKPYHG